MCCVGQREIESGRQTDRKREQGEIQRASRQSQAFIRWLSYHPSPWKTIADIVGDWGPFSNRLTIRRAFCRVKCKAVNEEQCPVECIVIFRQNRQIWLKFLSEHVDKCFCGISCNTVVKLQECVCFTGNKNSLWLRCLVADLPLCNYIFPPATTKG